jgi:aldehyde dehydrogenase (NAD+)
VADALVERVVAQARAVRAGFGLREGVTMGPSVDPGQLKTVLEYQAIGKKEGAKLLIGGERMMDSGLASGYFPAPTVFDHARPDMRISQEEIFGPVLSVLRVKSFEEAMQVANGVKYGLSSSLYSRDSNLIFRFLDQIETGITHVNSPTMGGEAHLPFGGMKSTGVGTREQGRVAIDFFTELKSGYIDYTGERRKTNLY